MKLTPLDPKDVPNYHSAGRGAISYPIIKQFLESDSQVSKLDQTGIPHSRNSITAKIRGYARRYDIPVKVFIRDGNIYLCRTDMDEDGNIIKPPDPVEITPDIIKRQAKGSLPEA